MDGTPDWRRWKYVPRVKLWEAVALSLNKDPERIGFYESKWTANELSREFEEFLDRAFIAKRNLEAGRIERKTLVLNNPYECMVDIGEFAAFAISVEWQIPDELASLAKRQQASVARNDRQEVGTRERETLLKMVLGMAIAGYSYEPEAAYSAIIAEIASDLARCGIATTDDTIRKWLKRAAEEVEWHLPSDKR